MTRRILPLFLLALAAAPLSVIATGAPAGASSGRHAAGRHVQAEPGSMHGRDRHRLVLPHDFPGRQRGQREVLRQSRLDSATTRATRWPSRAPRAGW